MYIPKYRPHLSSAWKIALSIERYCQPKRFQLIECMVLWPNTWRTKPIQYKIPRTLPISIRTCRIAAVFIFLSFWLYKSNSYQHSMYFKVFALHCQWENGKHNFLLPPMGYLISRKCKGDKRSQFRIPLFFLDFPWFTLPVWYLKYAWSNGL